MSISHKNYANKILKNSNKKKFFYYYFYYYYYYIPYEY